MTVVWVVWSTDDTKMRCFCAVFEVEEHAEAYAKHRRGYPGEENLWFVSACYLHRSQA